MLAENICLNILSKAIKTEFDWSKMSKISMLLKRLLLLAIILSLWEIGSRHVNSLFVPSPFKVYEDFLAVVKTGALIKAVCYSFRRIVISTVLASTVAVPMGLLIYNLSLARDIFHPIISVMRYIPVTAFYPLLIMWFGIDELMKIVFLFIAMFVYMMPSVMLCLEEINQDLIDTGLTIGMNKFQLVYRIQMPAALPSIMNSFIMMFGIGWTYIAVAETINAKYGLGYTIQQASARGRTDLVFMAIIMIVIVSVVFDNVAKLLVQKMFKWRYLNDRTD